LTGAPGSNSNGAAQSAAHAVNDAVKRAARRRATLADRRSEQRGRGDSACGNGCERIGIASFESIE
jgi:hypothetical protein